MVATEAFKDARIEDKLLRKQIVKGCKKISLAFKGVVEEDEDHEDEEEEEEEEKKKKKKEEEEATNTRTERCYF